MPILLKKYLRNSAWSIVHISRKANIVSKHFSEHKSSTDAAHLSQTSQERGSFVLIKTSSKGIQARDKTKTHVLLFLRWILIMHSDFLLTSSMIRALDLFWDLFINKIKSVILLPNLHLENQTLFTSFIFRSFPYNWIVINFRDASRA